MDLCKKWKVRELVGQVRRGAGRGRHFQVVVRAAQDLAVRRVIDDPGRILQRDAAEEDREEELGELLAGEREEGHAADDYAAPARDRSQGRLPHPKRDARAPGRALGSGRAGREGGRCVCVLCLSAVIL